MKFDIVKASCYDLFMVTLRTLVIDFLVERDGSTCAICGETLKPPICVKVAEALKRSYLAHRKCMNGDTKIRRDRAIGMAKEGKTRQEIAESLGVSVRTIYTYLEGE